MTLELFVFPPSPRAFKVMAVANYLGLDWTLRMVSLPAGDQRLPEYAMLNPNMKMPTLRHGDYVLWESEAICQYLASLRPERGLLPTDERARLEVTRWQFWNLAHLDPATVPYMRENVVKPLILGVTERDEAALAAAAEPFERAAVVLEGQLQRHRFVAGDSLTVADFTLGSALIYGEMAQLPLLPYPHIRRWYSDMSNLDAWKATLAVAMPTKELEAA